MERRHFLELTVGFVAGAGALAAGAIAIAAPLPPISAAQAPLPPQRESVESAVVSQGDVDRLKPEEVRWGRHWHRRHWGWHRRHWHRHRW